MSRMNAHWSWFLRLGIGMSGSAFGAAVSLTLAISTNCAIAQISPDTTLPSNSIVNPVGNTNIIEGGTKAGSNLFHSFQQFSIPTGDTALFNNAQDIQNIISRVTGGEVSNIDGLIRANGTANVFLLNPNGIIFGPNARLDIGGSFVGSTASSMKFADNTQFSATAPQTTPLLTISVPLGLQFGQTAASIVNRSRTTNSSDGIGLQVQPGKTLALVGGNVNLEGATMLAPSGRVELGAMAWEETVGFTVDSNNLSLSFPNTNTRADVKLTEGSFVGVAASGGGSIAINARNIDVLGGSYLFAGIESSSGAAVAGDITLNATEKIAVRQSSNIINEVSPNTTGNSGNIDINAESLDLENAFLSTSTFGQGNGGTININARHRVSFTRGGAFSQVEPDAFGNSGGINITTGSLSLTNSELLAHTKGKGNAGTISINARDTISLDQSSKVLSEVIEKQAVGNSGGINITTGSLFLTNGSFLATSTFGVGNGGSININARDRVSLTKSWALSQVERNAVGDSGDINITTGLLDLTNGALLATSTFGVGNSGIIKINARDKVSLTKSWAFNQVEPDATGNSGGINVTTGSLFLTNSELLAHTKGKGNAGTINLNARDTISLDQQSKVLSEVIINQAVGNSGSININTGSLDLTNGSLLATSTFGAGNAGTIKINARDRVSFTKSWAFSQVEPDATGDSGSIDITTGSLFLTNSELLAHTKGKGNAGTINLNTRDTISLDQQSKVLSEVIINQAVGNSGSININTGSLELTNGSFLATSTFGAGNVGTIKINARDKVSLTGRGVYSQVERNATGDSGSIDITTGSLFLTNSELLAHTKGKGNAGTINLNARDTIFLDQQSKVLSEVIENQAVGNSGSININTGSLELTNGSFLATSTFGVGNAGTIKINARDKVSLTGRGVYSQGNAVGDSGGINITTRSLFVTNNAEVSVSSEGIGNAGNLDIKANVIHLENQGKLRASTAAGTGGNITLSDLNLLLMRDRSFISAAALNDANGGNITINANNGFIVAVPRENSDIVANAVRGNGGNIDITASGIYGLENRSQQPRDSTISEINASSEFGFNGSVEINTPDIDPNSGLVELPTIPVDTEVASGCYTPGYAQSSFVITGRGGLPPNPKDVLTPDTAQIDWVSIKPSNNRSLPPVTTKPITSIPKRIVEATGTTLNAKGQIVLTANPSTVTPYTWFPRASCQEKS